jgi:hypothetical protein
MNGLNSVQFPYLNSFYLYEMLFEISPRAIKELTEKGQTQAKGLDVGMCLG